MSDLMSEVASSVLEPWVGQSLSLDTLESCFDALSSEAVAEMEMQPRSSEIQPR